MFEDSLHRFNDPRSVQRKRLLAAACFLLQSCALAALIVLPLLYPARLPAWNPRKAQSIRLLRPRPQPIVIKPSLVRVANASTPAAPASAPSPRPAVISRAAFAPPSDQPLLLPFGNALATGPALPAGFGSDPSAGTGTRPSISVKPAAPTRRPLNLSSGVTRGLLLAPIQPAYPRIAILTHTEGVVVLTATIDTAGRIVGLQVVSGPPLLRQAAADAVRQARYRPYLLNGQPTEVLTTISVDFHIGG